MSAASHPANAAAPDPLPAEELEQAKRQYRLLRRLAIATLALGASISFSLNLVDPDLWGHVTYGQELLRDGSLPRTATHTYSAPDHWWVNHENLAEILLAAGFDTLGVRGMLVAKCLLGMLLLGLMALVARRNGVRPLVTWSLLLLVAANLQAFFPMRPQLLSFFWCSLLLVVLERAFEDWKPAARSVAAGTINYKWLALAPVIIAAWVNSHGAFVAGLCILLALLGGRSVEALVQRRQKAWATVAALAGIGLLGLAATLANPYGVGLLRWLSLSLGSPRPEITEWAAPKMSDPVFWPFVTLLVVAAGAWAFTRRGRDWTKIAIMALVAWQAMSHLRHIAFFALLCGFWLPPHVADVLARIRRTAAEGLPVVRLSRGTLATMVGALAVAIVLQSVALGFRLSTLPVYRNTYPVDALDFMAQRQMKGRLVVAFNWAQYAIAALSPDIQVGFDGRFRTCYPQNVLDMHFDFLIGENSGRRFRSPDAGPIDGRRVLGFQNPNLVLIDRAYKHSVAVMRAVAEEPDSPWVLLYQDGVAQLWGCRNEFDVEDAPQYLPPDERIVTDHTPTDAVQWPALPGDATTAPDAPRANSRRVAAN